MWFSKNNFNVNGKTALIIGGSQGIGVNLATMLYKSNCSVILVARTESKLRLKVEEIESNIDSDLSAKVSYIKCDVSDYTSCVKLWQELNLQGYDPDYIFCCAGSSIPKLFKDLDENDFKQGSSTNYDTALNVIHTGFKQQLKLEDKFTKRRSIILFSSVVSFFPFIGYLQYAPMKSAIQSLSIILRQELLNYNYRVACVFPGNFQSEGFDQEQLTKPEITKKIEGPSNPISGDKCAKLILDQLNKGYDTITTDLIGWVLGCSALGMLPRQWGLLQIIMSFVFLLIQPIIDYFINKDIKSA